MRILIALLALASFPAAAKDTLIVKPWIGDRQIITDLDGRPKAVVKPWIGDRKIVEPWDRRQPSDKRPTNVGGAVR
jgi:hypothetical protein